MPEYTTPNCQWMCDSPPPCKAICHINAVAPACAYAAPPDGAPAECASLEVTPEIECSPLQDATAACPTCTVVVPTNPRPDCGAVTCAEVTATWVCELPPACECPVPTCRLQCEAPACECTSDCTHLFRQPHAHVLDADGTGTGTGSAAAAAAASSATFSVLLSLLAAAVLVSLAVAVWMRHTRGELRTSAGTPAAARRAHEQLVHAHVHAHAAHPQ